MMELLFLKQGKGAELKARPDSVFEFCRLLSFALTLFQDILSEALRPYLPAPLYCTASPGYGR